MKKFLKLFLVAVASFGIFTACDKTQEPEKTPTQQVQATVKSIAVDATTVPAEIVKGQAEAEIAKIKLVVTMSDDTTKSVNVTKDMISAKDLEKLADIGTYKVTITYEGKTVEVTLVVVEDEEVVTLTDITLTIENAEVAVNYGASHSVLDGVKAIGNDGVSYASKLTYVITNAAGQKVDKLDTQVENEVYTVVISIDFAGIKKSVTKKVTVGEKPDTSGNLLPNDQFVVNNGKYAGWDEYIADGGVATLETETINDKAYAKVVATSLASTPYGIRLNNNADNYFTLYNGQAYQVSFYAKAAANKAIQCQVGQLIGGAPYFYSFGGQTFQFEITTEMQLFSFTFVASNAAGGELSASSITFEMGKNNANDDVVTTIWLGDVSVTEFSGVIADQTAPVINAVNKTIFIGDCETVDLSSFITVNDAVDGDITPVYVIKNEAGETVTSIDGTVAGVYTVEISAEDAAGNTASSSIIVTVKERSGSANAFGTIEGVTNGGAENLAANPGKFLYWNVQSADWNCGPVTSTTVTYENGVLKFVNDMGENTNSWGIQGFYTIPVLEEGGNYTLSVNIKSSVAGKLSLNVGSQVNVVDVVVGDNAISVPAGELASGQSYQLTLLFGHQTGGEFPIGSGTFEFSNWKLSLPTNAFGTIEGVANGGAEVLGDNPGKFLYWYVQDAGWNCGPVTSTTVTYENGVLKFVNDMGENTNSWGIQGFYTIPVIEEDGTYNLSVNIKSSVAGKLSLNVGSQVNVIDIVVGDNAITVPAGTLTSGNSYQLTLLFGHQTGGEFPIGSGTFEFSNWKLVKGAAPEVDEEETPEVPAGPATESATFNLADAQLAFAEEKNMTAGQIGYWADGNWCGSLVTINAANITNKEILIDYSATGACTYGLQLFYKDATLTANQKYRLTMTITVNNAITININNQSVELVAGVNNVTVDYVEGLQVDGGGATSSLDIQVPVDNNANVIKFANINWAILAE